MVMPRRQWPDDEKVAVGIRAFGLDLAQDLLLTSPSANDKTISFLVLSSNAGLKRQLANGGRRTQVILRWR